MTKEDFDKGKEKVGDNDYKKIFENKKSLFEKIRKGPLRKVFEDVKTLFDMLKDYYDGAYRNRLPYSKIIAIVFTLIYIITPLDFVPDVIPFAGLWDDLLCVLMCLEYIKEDIGKYREWVKEN